MLRTTPLQRNSAGECGSIVSSRTISASRAFSRQIRPQETKTRCSPVRPSMTGASASSLPSARSAMAYALRAIDSPPRSPMFSPMVSAPLTWWDPSSWAGLKASYWAISALVRSSNSWRSASVHQSVEPARAVVLRALVVEAVADLVADDRPDPAVVPGVVGVGVEERRLEDRRGEDDLVHRRVVVGVDHLRRHEPLVAVHRLAELVEVAALLEEVRRPHVAEQVGRVDLQLGVVAPLVGVADLGPERLELGQGARLGLLAHPVQRGDGLAVGGDEVVHQPLHGGLVLGREVPGDVELADGLAQRALDERRRRASTARAAPRRR